MKKRKLSERHSPDFKNNPFKSLKGFSPTHAQTQPSVRKRTDRTENDSELFFRAVAGTKKIAQEDSSGPMRATGKPGKGAATVDNTPLEEQDNQIFLQAMQKIGTTMPKMPRADDEEMDHEKPRSASSRMRQLKRGTIRLAGELDLHGFLRDDAIARLENFLSSAYAKGREAVLVITGKGINSPDGPVLQGAVAAWLRKQGKRMVAEFAPSPRDLGGSGAFVVFLRKK